MPLKTAIICGLLCCLAISDAVEMRVCEGTLEGTTLQTVPSNVTYYSFKGIPYAEPPLSDLRFMPPKAAESWDGVRDATEHGSVCPQMDSSSNLIGSEDCLFVNVYTPNLEPVEPYAVVFYIHGGGFVRGSGDSSIYGPDFFIEKGVVVVTINYRLGPMGFLCLDNEAVPGNMGLKDQVLALKWVNKNIEYFGGNPKNITIMGQSAGGYSVTLHLISPMSEGLFQRAISMSGTPTSEFTVIYKPVMRSFKLGLILGKDTTNATELLEFLQSVDILSLINTNAPVSTSDAVSIINGLVYFNFLPVIEKDFGCEHFLTMNPLEAYKHGDVYKADLMFGVTNEEAITGIPAFKNNVINLTASYPDLLVPRKISYNCTPDTAIEISKKIRDRYFGNESISVENMKTFVKFASETYLSISVARFFSYFMPSGCNIYSYVFSSFSNRNYDGLAGVPYGIYGAGHFDELKYLFQPHSLNMTIDLHSTEYKFVDVASTVFSNFIKHGNPTPAPYRNITWPKYDAESKKYVNIANETLIISDNYLGDSIKFFDIIFQSAGIEF